jgi:hypothetical protein
MDKYLNLANRLYEVFRGNLTCVNTWGVYLFDSDFDSEPELRNKIGTIWFCALLDTLEAESRFIPAAIQEAEREGWESLVHNGLQLQNLCQLTSELLDSFTREEQIFLLDLRNQWTHGYLANRHRERVTVKYTQNGKLRSEQLSNSEYTEVTRVFFEQGNLDNTLKPIISRALDKKHRYWTAVGVLQKFEKEMYRILRDGETFNITV